MKHFHKEDREQSWDTSTHRWHQQKYTHVQVQRIHKYIVYKLKGRVSMNIRRHGNDPERRTGEKVSPLGGGHHQKNPEELIMFMSFLYRINNPSSSCRSGLRQQLPLCSVQHYNFVLVFQIRLLCAKVMFVITSFLLHSHSCRLRALYITDTAWCLRDEAVREMMGGEREGRMEQEQRWKRRGFKVESTSC